MIDPSLHAGLKSAAYSVEADLVKLHEHILSTVLGDPKLFGKISASLRK